MKKKVALLLVMALMCMKLHIQIPFILSNMNQGETVFKIQGFLSQEKTLDLNVIDGNLVNEKPTIAVLDTMDAQGNDDHGHGTLMVEAIRTQVGDDIAIKTIKVLDEQGQGSAKMVIKGIRKAIDEDVDIISMSFGAYINEDMKALTELLDQAMNQGILVFAAAGNYSSSVDGFYPAAIDGVISCSAIDEEGDFTYRSNTDGLLAVPVLERQSSSYATAYAAAMAGKILIENDVGDVVELLLKLYPNDKGRYEVGLETVVNGVKNTSEAGDIMQSAAVPDQRSVSFVVKEMGQPVSDAYVYLSDSVSEGTANAVTSLRMHIYADSGEELSFYGSTDQEGRVYLSGYEDDTQQFDRFLLWTDTIYRVEIDTGSLNWVTYVDGSTIGDGVINLEINDTSLNITGQIVDVNGNPLSGAQIMNIQDYSETYSDESGYFSYSIPEFSNSIGDYLSFVVKSFEEGQVLYGQFYIDRLAFGNVDVGTISVGAPLLSGIDLEAISKVSMNLFEREINVCVFTEEGLPIQIINTDAECYMSAFDDQLTYYYEEVPEESWAEKNYIAIRPGVYKILLIPGEDIPMIVDFDTMSKLYPRANRFEKVILEADQVTDLGKVYVDDMPDLSEPYVYSEVHTSTDTIDRVGEIISFEIVFSHQMREGYENELHIQLPDSYELIESSVIGQIEGESEPMDLDIVGGLIKATVGRTATYEDIYGRIFFKVKVQDLNQKYYTTDVWLNQMVDDNPIHEELIGRDINTVSGAFFIIPSAVSEASFDISGFVEDTSIDIFIDEVLYESVEVLETGYFKTQLTLPVSETSEEAVYHIKGISASGIQTKVYDLSYEPDLVVLEEVSVNGTSYHFPEDEGIMPIITLAGESVQIEASFSDNYRIRDVVVTTKNGGYGRLTYNEYKNAFTGEMYVTPEQIGNIQIQYTQLEDTSGSNNFWQTYQENDWLPMTEDELPEPFKPGNAIVEEISFDEAPDCFHVYDADETHIYKMTVDLENGEYIYTYFKIDYGVSIDTSIGQPIRLPGNSGYAYDYEVTYNDDAGTLYQRTAYPSALFEEGVFTSQAEGEDAIVTEIYNQTPGFLLGGNETASSAAGATVTVIGAIQSSVDYSRIQNDLEQLENLAPDQSSRNEVQSLQRANTINYVAKLSGSAFGLIVPLAFGAPFMTALLIGLSVGILVGYITSLVDSYIKNRIKTLFGRWLIDPSGYVYEGMESNRISGVRATVYYLDDTSTFVPWDAGEFLQKNPQMTDEIGYYGWDVLPGQWQVRFDKVGYETISSDVLTVPPVHTDVNIGLVSTLPPKIQKSLINGDHTKLTMVLDRPVASDSVDRGDFEIEGLPDGISFDLVESMEAMVMKIVIHFDKALESDSQLSIRMVGEIEGYNGLAMSPYEETISIEEIDVVPPKDVENIKRESEFQSMRLSWNPSISDDVEYTNVRVVADVNGEQVEPMNEPMVYQIDGAENAIHIQNLEPNSLYEITIHTVDYAGLESQGMKMIFATKDIVTNSIVKEEIQPSHLPVQVMVITEEVKEEPSQSDTNYVLYILLLAGLVAIIGGVVVALSKRKSNR